MSEKKKITIIGGGLGGLSAGALLAKDGYRVTLLEQHNIVGGSATTFKRKGGFTCEVGLHEMDGVYSNPQIKSIFETLGVYEDVTFVKPGEFFAITTTEGTFVMPEGVQRAIKALIDRFPSQKEGIERYFKLLAKVADEMGKLQNASWYHYLLFPLFFSNILRYKNRSTTQVLDSLISNEKLKLILNANIQYYNDTPDTLNFLLHAVAQHSYYSGGGWFIKGGSQKLSDHFAKVIKGNGGEVITRAEVLSCDRRHVTYSYKKETVTIESDIIISNLSPQQTYALFGVAYQESKEIADGLTTLYLGFSKNLKQVYGKRAYSHFIFDEISTIKEYKQMLEKDITQREFVFVDYSQVDSALTKDADKSFAVACWIDDIKHWEQPDSEAYRAKKEALINTTLTRLERYYPGISKLVEYAEVGTAKTVQRYIKTPQGTAYGFKPSPKQFFRMPKVKSDKVDSLYFVGQWIIAGGFSPTILSGKLCYDAIKSKKK